MATVTKQYNNLRLGGNTPSNYYLGSNEVLRIYLGNTEVYNSKQYVLSCTIESLNLGADGICHGITLASYKNNANGTKSPINFTCKGVSYPGHTELTDSCLNNVQLMSSNQDSERTEQITLQQSESNLQLQILCTQSSDSIINTEVEVVTAASSGTDYEYSDVSITTFTYNDASASGNAATVNTLTYSQTKTNKPYTISAVTRNKYTWASGNITYSANTGGQKTYGTQTTTSITSGATPSYSGTGVNTSSGSVSANNLTTTPKDRTKIATSTVSITLNGKSGTKSADVYQQANVLETQKYKNTSGTTGTNKTYGIPNAPTLTGTLTVTGGTLTCSGSSATDTETWYQKYTSGSWSTQQSSTSASSIGYRITSNGNNRFVLSGTTITHLDMGTNYVTDSVSVQAYNLNLTSQASEEVIRSVTNIEPDVPTWHVQVIGTNYGMSSKVFRKYPQGTAMFSTSPITQEVNTASTQYNTYNVIASATATGLENVDAPSTQYRYAKLKIVPIDGSDSGRTLTLTPWDGLTSRVTIVTITVQANGSYAITENVTDTPIEPDPGYCDGDCRVSFDLEIDDYSGTVEPLEPIELYTHAYSLWAGTLEQTGGMVLIHSQPFPRGQNITLYFRCHDIYGNTLLAETSLEVPCRETCIVRLGAVIISPSVDFAITEID